MIVSRLLGGLGNQMFQYAAGRALSLRHQTNLKLDLTALQADAKGKYTQRHYELQAFDTIIEIADRKDVALFAKSQGKIAKQIRKLFPSLYSSYYAIEKGNLYHQDFEQYPKDTYLEGYWQSELYFKPYSDIIRRDFQFKSEIISTCSEWSKLMNQCNSVSLHIRRGDYVSNANALAFHGICSLDYYENAIRIISEKESNLTLFIFSDDLEWCKNNLKFDLSTHFVATDNAYQDLHLMTQCRHNVIANSSFSWWGAWLNRNPNKIVIAPNAWFNDTSVNTSDVIPKTWIKI
jgi:hypothetical protein